MFLQSRWQWSSDFIHWKYTVLANGQRKSLHLFIAQARGKTEFGKVTQITHKAGEVHVTYVLHTPLQSKGIYSFLVNLAWHFFPQYASLHTEYVIISHFWGPTTHFIILVTWQLSRFFLLRWYSFAPFISFIFPSGSIAINQRHKIKLYKINISAGGNSGNINN